MSDIGKNTGVNPRVVVVPLGVSGDSVKNVVNQIESENKPKKLPNSTRLVQFTGEDARGDL